MPHKDPIAYREYRRMWAIQKRVERKAAGLCIACGNPNDRSEGLKCTRCWEIHKVANRRWNKERRRVDGLCRWCGKPVDLPEVNRQYCLRCRKKDLKRRQRAEGRIRAKRAEEGLCIRCGKHKLIGFEAGLICLFCRDREARRKRALYQKTQEAKGRRYKSSPKARRF